MENDKKYEYEALQYSIEHNLQLVIEKNRMGNSKWLVLQKLPDGGLKPLFGKTRVFSVAHEKIPRIY